jgi:cathepsin B
MILFHVVPTASWTERMGNNSLKELIFCFRCNGGDPDLAFQYFINQGIVTEGCKPYTISPDPKSDAPKNTECVKSCESSYKKKYENDKIRGEDLLKFSHNNQAVMEEIMTNGSVIAELKLFDDFLSYKSGIYQHKSGKLRGYYYAKILGWGKTDNNVEYWRAAASFGSDWGRK